MRKRSSMAAVTAAVLAVFAAAAGSPASAAPDKPVPTENAPFSSIDPAVKAKMLAQAPLVAAASRIRQAIDRGSKAGYAGIILEGSEVVVYWRGRLPHAVGKAINSERRSVPVRVAPAAHSRAELKAAVARIDAELRTNPGSPFWGIEIAVDGSGVVVNADASAVRGRVLAVPSRWRVPASVPISIKYGPRGGTATRLSDSAPFWGGGRIVNTDNGSFCTAGWSVTANNNDFMLTAGHCGRPNGGWNNGDGTRFFGTGSSEHVGHDLLLISAQTGPRIWEGGVGINEFTRAVAGSADAVPNEFLCSSGSVSGAICNFKVSTSFQATLCDFDAYGVWECWNDLVTSFQQNGIQAAIPGDSGGPVFSIAGDGRVIAKGTITGWGGGTSTKQFFQDFVTAQRDFGITVQTAVCC